MNSITEMMTYIAIITTLITGETITYVISAVRAKLSFIQIIQIICHLSLHFQSNKTDISILQLYD